MTKEIVIPYYIGRLVVLGDLHFDSYLHQTRLLGAPIIPEVGRLDQKIDFGEVDALIIAGDLSGSAAYYWPKAIDYLDRYIRRDRIYILPGNHDYYGARLDDDEVLSAIAKFAGAPYAAAAPH